MHVLPIFVAGALATSIVSLFLSRFRQDGGREWSVAWLAFYTAGCATALPPEFTWSRALYPFLGTIFSGLLYAGTRRYVARPVRPHFLQGILAIAVLRGAAEPWVPQSTTQQFGALLLTAAVVASIYNIVRFATPASWAQRLLIASLLSILATHALYAFAKSGTPGLVLTDTLLAVLCSSTLTAGFQIAAIWDRQLTRVESQRAALAATFDAVPVGLAWSDATGRVRSANRMLLDTLQIEETRVVGQPANILAETLSALVEPGSNRRTVESSAMRPAFGERELPFIDGRLIVSGVHPMLGTRDQTLGKVWLLEDITEARRLQEEIHRSRQLETLGRLAGGVAHDFNNKLTAILGNASTLSESLEASDPRQRSLADLEEAAQYCASLTRGLLDFSRQTPRELGSVDAEPILKRVTDEIQAQFPEVHFKVEIDPELPLVQADRTDLERLFSNLLSNAGDAVSSGGMIQIRAIANHDVLDQPRIEISVRDDGIGMDYETRERIFDPFFSTKQSQGGTGLGLSIVYGIVRGCGGDLLVESEPGRGTLFRVLLRVGFEVQHPDRETRLSDSSDGRARTVLLVEDEEQVRRLLVSAFSRAGYEVLEARGAEEALELLERSADPSIVIADAHLPGLSGLELVNQLRASRPEIASLLVSGNIDEFRAVAESSGIPVLEKPFRPSEILRAASEAMESAARPHKRGTSGNRNR